MTDKKKTDRLETIRSKLMDALSPTELIINDDSAEHIGHPGAKSGQGHFSVIIGGAIFKDKSLVECHRLIYTALGDALGKEIHALQIRIKK